MKKGYKQTEVGVIPEEWEILSIGDVCKLQGGYAFKRFFFKNEGTPIIRISNIQNECVELSDVVYYDQAIDKSFWIEKDAVLIAMSGATTGKIGRYNNLDKAYLNQRVGMFVIKEKNKFDNNFLFQIVRTKQFQEKVITDAIGGAQPNISGTQIENIKLPLPPLPEQKKIAQILTSVDETIETTRKVIEQTKKVKQGLLQELLTKGISHTKFKKVKLNLKYIEIPDDWVISKLGNMTVKVGSGVTPKGGKKAYLDKGIPFFRSQNVLNGKIFMQNIAYISQEQHQKMSSTKLIPKDVLLNITGASIGRSAVFPNEIIEGNVNQHVCIIRTKPELDPYLLSFFLNSKYGQNQILMFQAGGNREGLNFQQIKSFMIPLPSIKEQKQIAQILSSIDQKITKQESELQQLQTLKKGLMQDLLTGAVRVTLQ